MVQTITAELTEKINRRKVFYIKFPHIDDEHIYYPNYKFRYVDPQIDDIVAWIWGDVVKFGVVYAICNSRDRQKCTVSAYLLPRGTKHRKSKGWKNKRGERIKVSALRCIFALV